MKKELFRELGRMSLMSILIFTGLFLALFGIEYFNPELQGTLLQWSDPAFLVGIPASVFGVAYVLTIRNPKNYLGFYFGVIMALLLSVQFYFQGNYDLVVLYTAMFVPFVIASLVKWRKQTLHPELCTEDSGAIAFISHHKFVITCAISMAIIVVDYALITLVLNKDGWGDQIVIKLLSGAMISTAIMANYWMIYKKNDAWLNWVLYSLVGIAFYMIVNNAFSLILFVVFLLVNGQAQFVWLNTTDADKFGWAGSEEYIRKLRSRR